MSRAHMSGNVFVVPVGEVLLIDWQLIDSDSTMLYTPEKRVPRCTLKCPLIPRSSGSLRSVQSVVPVYAAIFCSKYHHCYSPTLSDT